MFLGVYISKAKVSFDFSQKYITLLMSSPQCTSTLNLSTLSSLTMSTNNWGKLGQNHYFRNKCSFKDLNYCVIRMCLMYKKKGIEKFNFSTFSVKCFDSSVSILTCLVKRLNWSAKKFFTFFWLSGKKVALDWYEMINILYIILFYKYIYT